MPDTPNNEQYRPERRSHRRIQDAVALQIQRLHDMPAAGDAGMSNEVSGKIRQISKYEIEGYAEVKRDYPAVCEYLDVLEERIRRLQLDGLRPSASPTHKVSLSAGGMAFADEMLLYPGELIAVSITLFPSLERIGCDARVISAGDAPEIADGDKHTYRIAFVRMSNEDSQAIERHVQAVRKTLPLDAE